MRQGFTSATGLLTQPLASCTSQMSRRGLLTFEPNKGGRASGQGQRKIGWPNGPDNGFAISVGPGFAVGQRPRQRLGGRLAKAVTVTKSAEVRESEMALFE